MKHKLALMLFSMPIPISIVLAILTHGTKLGEMALLNLFIPIFPLILTGLGSYWLENLDIAACRQNHYGQQNHL